MPTECPVTGGPLLVTRLECESSGVTIEGRFTPNEFAMLPAENLEFLRIFVKVRGNLKEVERVLGLSFRALKPGGALGIEQHRASNTGVQDSPALTGYVQEAFVRTVTQQAGFEFVAASDLNANARDTRDHPFHVWTLPPDLRTSPLGQPDDPTFDTSPYQAIGESDRMTLKFRKSSSGAPAAPPASTQTP